MSDSKSSAAKKDGLSPCAVPRMPLSLSLSPQVEAQRGGIKGDEHTCLPPASLDLDLDLAGIQEVTGWKLGREIRKYGQKIHDGRQPTSRETGAAALLGIDPERVTPEQAADPREALLRQGVMRRRVAAMLGVEPGDVSPMDLEVAAFLEWTMDAEEADALRDGFTSPPQMPLEDCPDPRRGLCVVREAPTRITAPEAPGEACAPCGDALFLGNLTADFSTPCLSTSADIADWPCNAPPRAVRYPTLQIEIPENPSPLERRNIIYQLQRHLARHDMVSERARECLTTEAPHVDRVSVEVASTWSPDKERGRKARYSGVKRCGCIHGCVVCGQKRGLENAHRIFRAAWNHTHVHKRQLYHLILSIPHAATDDPSKLLEVLQDSWSRWNSGRHGPLSRHHCAGWIRVLEVVWGDHGPHFHFHVLVFRDTPWAGTGEGWVQVPYLVGEGQGESAGGRLVMRDGTWKRAESFEREEGEPLEEARTVEGEGVRVEHRWEWCALGQHTTPDRISERLREQAEQAAGIERAHGLTEGRPLDTSALATWWTAAVTRWISSVEHVSKKVMDRELRPSVEGQWLESVPTLGCLPRYIAKAGLAVGFELGYGAAKASRSGGSRTPFQIAWDVATRGRPDDVALWRRHLGVMEGKSILTTSQSSKAVDYERNPFTRYADGEEPPEVPREDGWIVGESEEGFTVAPWLYRAVRRLGLDLKLLQEVERLGPDRVAELVEVTEDEIPPAAIPCPRLANRLAGRLLAWLRREPERPPPEEWW